MQAFAGLSLLPLLCSVLTATAAATQIEEIIVTAQKRSQAISDVAISITALDAATIAALELVNATDLQQHTPNLYIKESFSQVNPTIFLRGVGINDFNANVSSAVGVYVDETYIGSPSALLFPLFDLERIEVLAGPQGTLFGRNTTAGSIQFVTRKPTPETDASLRLRYGRFDEIRATGALGGSLNDRAQARLSFDLNQRDGTALNALTGNRVNDTDHWAARLQIAAQPSERSDVLLRVESSRSDALARQYKSRGLVEDNENLLGYRDTDDIDTGRYNQEGPEMVEVDTASLRVALDGDQVDFVSLTSIQRVDRFTAENSDANPLRMLELTAGNQSWHYSQELRWEGDWGDARRWTAGAYYYADRIDSETTYDVLRELRGFVGFNPNAFVFFARHQYRQATDALAAFGQIDFDVSPRWTVSTGLRYTDESRDFVSTAFFDEEIGQIPILDVDDETSFGALSGRIAAEYRPQAGGIAYASVSRGFKSGGFNGGLAFTPLEAEPFDEEILVNYEVGFKGALADGRVRFGTAAFYYDYSDLQVFTIVNTGGVPISVLDNAADAEVYGFEGWLDAQPLERLRLRASIGLTETETRRFLTDLGDDFTGNELAAAPDLTFNGIASYRWPVPGGAVEAMVDYRYTGDFFFDTANSPRLRGGDYWLVNARLSWRSTRLGTEVSLWTDNALDERYMANAFDLSDFGFDQIRWSDPRTYGVTLRWQWN